MNHKSFIHLFNLAKNVTLNFTPKLVDILGIFFCESSWQKTCWFFIASNDVLILRLPQKTIANVRTLFKVLLTTWLMPISIGIWNLIIQQYQTLYLICKIYISKLIINTSYLNKSYHNSMYQLIRLINKKKYSPDIPSLMKSTMNVICIFHLDVFLPWTPCSLRDS